MRTAALAMLEYLIGFIALGAFAYLAFGRGHATDESLVFAFKASSSLAVAELAFLLTRNSPANRLILGANLWLIAGGAAAFSEQWWWLRVDQHFGEARLFLAMLLVGVFTVGCWLDGLTTMFAEGRADGWEGACRVDPPTIPAFAALDTKTP